MKFAESRPLTEAGTVLIAEVIWITAMRNVIRLAKMAHGMIVKNVKDVNTICTMFTGNQEVAYEGITACH